MLNGGGSDDLLFGEDGDDTLDGGTGVDTLVGGSGTDIYVVDTTGDVIAEYYEGDTDTVRTTLASYALGSREVEKLTYAGSANFTVRATALPP